MDSKTLADIFSLVFGAGLSALVKIVPFLDTWYQTKLNPNLRGLVMLGFSLLVPVGVYGVSCLGVFNLVPCTPTIVPDMARAWGYFVIANQGVFMMTPNSKATNARKDIEKGLLFGTGRESVTHPTGEPQ